MNFWISQVFNGISYGSLLFLLAGGLTLIFGMMRIVNMTHGSYYLLGGYVALTVMWRDAPFVVGILAGALAIALIGVGEWNAFLKRLSGQELGQVLTTMGFALIFQDLALVVWGGDPYTISIPAVLDGSWVVGNLYFPIYRVFIIAVAASVATTPIVPCPHIPRYPTLLKKMTPAAQRGSDGSQSSAPTITSEPRGSLTTAERKRSYSVRKRSRRSASVPSPRSGPPSTTSRVGSPPVCESMTRMRCMRGRYPRRGVSSCHKSLLKQACSRRRRKRAAADALAIPRRRKPGSTTTSSTMERNPVGTRSFWKNLYALLPRGAGKLYPAPC